MLLISVLSCTLAAPSLLEYGVVSLMGSVTPSIPLELGSFCLFRLLGAAMLMVVLTLCLGFARDVAL